MIILKKFTDKSVPADEPETEFTSISDMVNEQSEYKYMLLCVEEGGKVFHGVMFRHYPNEDDKDMVLDELAEFPDLGMSDKEYGRDFYFLTMLSEDFKKSQMK